MVLKNILCSICLILGAAPSFADANMSGSWQRKVYSITFDSTFQTLRGAWGDQQYNLRFDGDFNYIRGTSAGRNLDVRFDPDFKYARGTLPCGAVSLSYDQDFNYIRGSICDSNISQTLSDGPQTRYVFIDLVLSELVSDFPAPIQGQLKRLISQTVHY